LTYSPVLETDKWLEDPSKAIKKDLIRLLGGGFEFPGSFYSSDSFPQAPNPCLNVDGVGPLGLPLTEAAAKRLISGSRQAPVGKGERTVVDTTVRDTWEIDAAKVFVVIGLYDAQKPNQIERFILTIRRGLIG
jgi:hypothetical protein